MVRETRNPKRANVSSASLEAGQTAGQEVQGQAARMDASQVSHVVAMHRLLKASYLITQPFFTNFADRYEVTMNECASS
jgi:hypothetical protein